MDGQLLDRIFLRFAAETGGENVRMELSAAAFDADGNLWVAGDEDAGLSRLRPRGATEFRDHCHFSLIAGLKLPAKKKKTEIDVEGLDWHDGHLWMVGSHTSTRLGIDDRETTAKNLKRLAKVKRRPNRFVIGCVAVEDGEVRDRPAPRRLSISGKGNQLTKALRRDRHLAPFVNVPKGKHRKRDLQLASKENGFDVEGLAVRGDRVFLGLRGPVLREWALVLEIEPERAGRGELRLKKIGADGSPYRKHFLKLGGMGVRDLLWQGDDLLILTGPTMDITGLQTLYRLTGAAHLGDHSLIAVDDGQGLRVLFNLPVVQGGDKAEGLARYDGLGQPGLLVVYDSPQHGRLESPDGVYADVYALPAP